MPEFEIYRRERPQVVKEPAVTLAKRGQLSLNESAYVALGSPAAVELMYSRSDRVVGMRAVDPEVPHAYKPRAPARSNGHGPWVVSGSAFLSYFEIKVDQTRRYQATVQDGILSIDLKKPGSLPSNQGSRKRGGGSAW